MVPILLFRSRVRGTIISPDEVVKAVEGSMFLAQLRKFIPALVMPQSMSPIC